MTQVPRTYLFVPGDRPERFDKALASGADAVVLDLEDAVATDDKPRARDAVAQRLRTATVDERTRWVVRINDEASAVFDADLAMLAACNVACVMLPKAERAATVVRVRAACPDIAVLALIETARGVLNAHALAEAPGVQRLVFGTIDFALDLHLSGDPLGFDHAASHLALVSRAAGLASPVAGVTPEDHGCGTPAGRPATGPRAWLFRQAVHPSEAGRHCAHRLAAHRDRARLGPARDRCRAVGAGRRAGRWPHGR